MNAPKIITGPNEALALSCLAHGFNVDLNDPMEPAASHLLDPYMEVENQLLRPLTYLSEFVSFHGQGRLYGFITFEAAYTVCDQYRMYLKSLGLLCKTNLSIKSIIAVIEREGYKPYDVTFLSRLIGMALIRTPLWYKCFRVARNPNYKGVHTLRSLRQAVNSDAEEYFKSIRVTTPSKAGTTPTDIKAPAAPKKLTLKRSHTIKPTHKGSLEASLKRFKEALAEPYTFNRIKRSGVEVTDPVPSVITTTKPYSSK